jgi:hypothetical protein
MDILTHAHTHSTTSCPPQHYLPSPCTIPTILARQPRTPTYRASHTHTHTLTHTTSLHPATAAPAAAQGTGEGRRKRGEEGNRKPGLRLSSAGVVCLSRPTPRRVHNEHRRPPVQDDSHAAGKRQDEHRMHEPDEHSSAVGCSWSSSVILLAPLHASSIQSHLPFISCPFCSLSVCLHFLFPCTPCNYTSQRYNSSVPLPQRAN